MQLIVAVERNSDHALQREELGLPEYGDWWRGSVAVPKTAEVLDLVMSDAAKSAWENNRGQDFHTPVRGALSKEQLMQARH